MRRVSYGAGLLAALLAACAPMRQALPASSAERGAPAAIVLKPGSLHASKAVRPRFFITVPPHRADRRKAKRADFIPASSASIEITLNTVDGGPPPPGLKTSVVSNIGACTGGCIVAGPAAPAGSDSFTLTIFDAANGGGHPLSTATQTFALERGKSNAESLTLLGIPASFAFAGLPAGSAGSAFSAKGFSLNVLDAAGDVITGNYSSSVTLSDGDTSGATGLSLNGAAGALSIAIAGSGDALALNYTGLAIASATLTAQASSATTGIATFVPSVAGVGVVCDGGGNGDTTECGTTLGGAPQINLWNAAGGAQGNAATFTASQTGWTSAPYDKPIAESDNCSSIATITLTLAPGEFTATAKPTDSAAASCTITLTGGAQPMLLPLTFTNSALGIH